jgi:AraC-like DNA-binding protein
MNASVKTDIIGMLRHLVFALKSFAKIHDVDFSFQSDHDELIVSYDPEEIINVITKLICRIVVYTAPKQSLSLTAAFVQEPERKILVIQIHITGTNLSRIGQITQDLKHHITVQFANEETIFKLEWPLEEFFPSAEKINNNHPVSPQSLPGFYAKIRKHLQSHFTKAGNLIASLASRDPKDAAFLQKVNILILTNIDKDGFNANNLSTAMGMSRAQLYRRLQPIIRQAPGHYIQTMRIQKAKELLETTDMRIGEVAFKTGFQTPSHFTRVFTKHYGVRPSIFCRKTKM